MSTPQKNVAAIAHRLTIAREDAETMRTKAAYIGNHGGPHPLFARIEFHVALVALLEWAEGATAEEIDERRLELREELGAAVTLKGGSMLDLPAGVVTRIAHLEHLEYALGIHASQRGAA